MSDDLEGAGAGVSVYPRLSQLPALNTPIQEVPRLTQDGLDGGPIADPNCEEGTDPGGLTLRYTRCE